MANRRNRQSKRAAQKRGRKAQRAGSRFEAAVCVVFNAMRDGRPFELDCVKQDGRRRVGIEAKNVQRGSLGPSGIERELARPAWNAVDKKIFVAAKGWTPSEKQALHANDVTACVLDRRGLFCEAPPKKTGFPLWDRRGW